MNYVPMIPIWLQVATALKRDIVTGRIQPGEKLPGGRDLALQYEINPNTAARIYQELERERICETRRGLGTFVTSDRDIILQLRREMAKRAVESYLREMRGLGFSREEGIQLLRMEEEENAEK